MTIILIFIIILEILLLFYLQKSEKEYFEQKSIHGIQKREEDAEKNGIVIDSFGKWIKHVGIKTLEEAETLLNIDDKDKKNEKTEKHNFIKEIKEYAKDFIQNKINEQLKRENDIQKNYDFDERPKDSQLEMENKEKNENSNDTSNEKSKQIMEMKRKMEMKNQKRKEKQLEKIREKKLKLKMENERKKQLNQQKYNKILESKKIKQNPQEIVEKTKVNKKKDLVNDKTLKEDEKNLREQKNQHQKDITYTDYINYHKDWIVPSSRPYTCSPPQKYANSPFVEYQLSNGTPLSFLDETTVGYILPKFLYKEYN